MVYLECQNKLINGRFLYVYIYIYIYTHTNNQAVGLEAGLCLPCCVRLRYWEIEISPHFFS